MTKFLLALLFFPVLAFSQPTVVIYNVTNDTVMDGSLDTKEVSIASISKLLTVYTVLKSEQDLDERLLITSKKLNNTKLNQGMILTRRELIDMALVSSDNVAALTLGENYPGGLSYFMFKMNEYARELNMHNSKFIEPTGLSPMNYSTVNDIVILTKAASEFDIVKMAAQSHKVVTHPAIPAKQSKHIKNLKQALIISNPTSRFFGLDGLVTIKTGFTRAAGFCITMLVKANNQVYNIVVLGAKTTQERQKIVEKSLKLIYNT